MVGDTMQDDMQHVRGQVERSGESDSRRINEPLSVL